MLIFDLLYLIALLPTLPLWIKVLLKKEYRMLLRHRLSPGISRSKRKRIWIHAVSVGEVRSLKYLIFQLEEIYKHMEIVLSVSTPAGYMCAKEEYKTISVINAPLDFSFTIRKFLKYINPEILILNELEIWPNWIRITCKKKIPVLLINGRISERAFHKYKKGLFFFRYFFKRIEKYLVQAELYKERFLTLGIPSDKIKVCGNIKADEAINRMQYLPPGTEILSYLRIAPGGKKILTFASSHKQDEELIGPILNDLSNNYFIIIIPRHLERVDELELLLEKFNVKYSTWSKTPKNDYLREGVLIFDKMGYLFNVLHISDIVYMGGTMDPVIGGHNLYEPASLGKCIIGGPHFNNFPDIGNELLKRGVYHCVCSIDECKEYLTHSDSIDWESIHANALQAVSTRRGSIQCIIDEIGKIIPQQVE